jgi:hypothetical protein
MASGPVWHRTAKHEVIQAWAKARNAQPARVRGTTDALKLKFGDEENSWEPITWDEWFAIFDEKEFAFVYEDPGFANKIVRRNGKEDGGTGSAH